MSTPGQVTVLLRQWREGKQRAKEELAALIYPEMRRLASYHMRANRDLQPVLSPTELVHEAYLRLCGQERPDFEHRTHFYHVAARIMRQVLVDIVREKKSLKRGAGRAPVTLDATRIASGEPPVDVLDIHQALEEMEQFDPRKASVLELQFFVGLRAEEIADLLGVAVITIRRDARAGIAWLRDRLRGPLSEG